MQRLLAAGLTVSPDHYDPLLRMEAARGSLPAARAMLAAMAADARFAPPTVSSYNALLKGLVSALQPVAAPGEEGVVEGLKGGRVAMSAEEVEVAMTAVKEEMVGRGLRPSRWVWGGGWGGRRGLGVGVGGAKARTLCAGRGKGVARMWDSKN